jgi:hypothetical protein
VRVERDGSVEFDVFKYPDLKFMGEARSGPLVVKPNEGTPNLYFANWINTNYPKYVNDTCGLHAHLKMKCALAYQRLMEPSFPATVLAYVTRWAEESKLPRKHPIWDRLSGKSEFCQHKYYPVEQVTTAAKDFDKHRSGHRYTVVNYCWSRFGTMEIRLLPMMDTAELAISAIQNLINITNAYLLVTGRKEEKLITVAKEDSSSVEEETRIRA